MTYLGIYLIAFFYWLVITLELRRICSNDELYPVRMCIALALFWPIIPLLVMFIPTKGTVNENSEKGMQ